MMIGARDMAFPRLNAVAFWIIPPAGLLLIGSLLIDAPDAGWTLPSLSLTTGQVGQLGFLACCCLVRPRFWALIFSSRF